MGRRLRFERSSDTHHALRSAASTRHVVLEEALQITRLFHMKTFVAAALALVTVAVAGAAAGGASDAGKTVTCREYGPLRIEAGVWTRKGRKESSPPSGAPARSAPAGSRS
jgi:hypothetical protein